MIASTSGVYVSSQSRLPHWQKACAFWVETIHKMCLHFGYGDAPWEYLEKTNSAILAGALTQAGLLAMPETYVMRNTPPAQGNQRVDICSFVDDRASTAIELVECKLAECK